jgi:hypothetical protein
MTNHSTTASSCLSRLFQRLRFNALRRDTSSTFSTPARSTAQISAASLVLASTGLGAYYTWNVGAHHGVILAALFVLFATGLELSKPLAVAAAFAAFRSFSIGRGAALAMLAIVAITYSLTAELSLMATSRGDTVASREASIKATNDAEADRKRAVARYDAAVAELAALPTTRPTKELQAEIDGLLLKPGTNGCVVIDGRVTRDVCPKVAELRKELARAERRAELEAITTTPLPIVIGTTTGDTHNIKDADPGAKALATYLALLGVVIPPAALGEWMVLIPVLALEIGSALAGVLVQSVSGPRTVHAPANRKDAVVQTPAPQVVAHVVQPTNTGQTEDEVQAREKVKSAIVNRLKQTGGSVKGGERGLAKLIGTNRSTMKRAINGLVMAGVIAAEATRNGTMLRLVA